MKIFAVITNNQSDTFNNKYKCYFNNNTFVLPDFASLDLLVKSVDGCKMLYLEIVFS